MKYLFGILLLFVFVSVSAQEENEEPPGTGCFSYQTKTIYLDREMIDYPRTYRTIEACQAAMAKVKTGKDGNFKWEIIKSCGPCTENSDKTSNNNGYGSSPASSTPNTGSGQNNSPKNTNPKHTPAKPAPDVTTSPQGKNQGRNNAVNPKSVDTQSIPATPSIATKEEQVAQTLVQASPGIQSAIQEYRAEKQAQQGQTPSHDEKPDGYASDDIPASEWVMSNPSKSEAAKTEYSNSWQQDAQAVWDGVKDVLGFGSAAAGAVGNEQFSDGFSTVSDMIGYLETAGRVEKAIQNPNDYENRAALAQNAFNYAAEAGGAAGSKFGPPVDLWKRTFEGSTARMESLIKTGDPGDELQVTAPLMDWFGSNMGIGNVGSRERNRRMEGYKSFTELKNQYGYVEATKQKIYNWMVDSK